MACSRSGKRALAVRKGISERLGISFGKINFCLNALIAKGCLQIKGWKYERLQQEIDELQRETEKVCWRERMSKTIMSLPVNAMINCRFMQVLFRKMIEMTNGVKP